jgi:hypothetical protein
MLDYEAFLEGIKPALYINSNRPEFEEKMNQLLSYPYIQGKDHYLFFQSDELKQKFIQETKGLSEDSLEYDRVLGISLGIPLRAVEFFVTKNLMGNPGDGIGVGYAGLRFSCNPNELEQILIDLWDKYQINEDARIRIGTAFYYIGYRDYDQLNEIANKARRETIT